MDENVSIYDDFNTDKVDEWNFEKNTHVDILEEPSNSEKCINWICSNCRCEYKGKINRHSQYKCPNCGDKMLYKGISGYKKKWFWHQVKNYIYIAIVSFVITFLQYGVTYKWEKITQDLTTTLLFSAIILLELINICVIVERINLNKDKQLIKVRYTLYNLFKNCDDINIVKDSYFKTIENRLIFLARDRIKEFNKQEILDMFKCHKINNFIDSWVDKKDKSEFKTLLLIYRNDCYFYKLYSSFETSQLINFSNDVNVKTLGISVIITIISLFLSIYPTINDWNLFIRKVALLIVPVTLIIITMIFNFRNQKKLMINNYKFDTIYISSAIAKIKNNK